MSPGPRPRCSRVRRWAAGAALGFVGGLVDVGDLVGADPRLGEAAASDAQGDPTPRDVASALEAQCREPDAAFRRTAATLLEGKRLGRALPGGAALEDAVRAEGSELVWPEAWYGAGGDVRALARALERWRARAPAHRVERCGAAAARSDGVWTAVVVRTDAWAELAAPLPTRPRTGQWVRFAARLHGVLGEARVVVAPARRGPHVVPSHRRGDTVEATFALEEPGPFGVQVVIETTEGPRPVLATVLHTDDASASVTNVAFAPGEDVVAADPEAALAAMIDAAREHHGLPRLSRDRALDALAAEHARAMRDAGRVAHDVGSGDLRARARAAALDTGELGENVAESTAVFLAHRSLYTSPSHRANLLGERWARFGVAVVVAPNGSVWVTETFAR